jgi:hypothetical protein
MSTIDPKHVTIQTAGNVYYSNRPRAISTVQPTPEQAAIRERAMWNAAVEKRKAERTARRAQVSPPSLNTDGGSK